MIERKMQTAFYNQQICLFFRQYHRKTVICMDIDMALCLENVTYEYESGTAMYVKALEQVSIKIDENEFIGIIGHTGSGKSTLIQLMNGLLVPTQGQVLLNGEDINGKEYNKRQLHCNIGLVFQYPENQLFESSVLKDVMFGPLNKGMIPVEAEHQAKLSLSHVNIGEEYYDKIPFELSGGEKRRVAIAGVMAMNPEILILDEPTAGLDPHSRDELLNSLAELHRNGKTILIVSHSMEDVAKYVDRIIVLKDGHIQFDGNKSEVFSHVKELEAMGLSAPETVYLMKALKKHGINVREDIFTVSEAVEELRCLET